MAHSMTEPTWHADARLEVADGLGRRIVPIDKAKFTLGRREANDLRLQGAEVSRDHAVILRTDDAFHVQDLKSRYGTFVNDAEITDQALDHGDQIRLGRGGGAEIVFLVQDAETAAERNTTTAVTDLRHIAALLEGLHALGSGRVLDEVLSLVMDSAITVGSAERGFIMLANEDGELEFKLGRGRNRAALAGAKFQTSRKIPEEVFETGESRIVADLMDGDLANVHMGTVALGIRNVHCVPLKLVRYVDEAHPAEEQRRIGVLYLDSREKGSLMSSSTRGRPGDTGDRGGGRHRERQFVPHDAGEGEAGSGDANRRRDSAGALAARRADGDTFQGGRIDGGVPVDRRRFL